MSDDSGVQITSGGAVAVDTGSLRNAAERFHGLARQLCGLAGALRGECTRLQASAGSWGWALPGGMLALGDVAGVVGERADGIAAKLTHAASVYEVIELRVAIQQAEAAGDVQAEQRVRVELDAVLAAEPGLTGEADGLVDAYLDGVADEDRRLGSQHIALVGGVVGGAGGTLVAFLGRGRMLAGIDGPPTRAVHVHQVGRAASGVAPSSLAEVVHRIPDGDPAKRPLVRVERYSMPDGSRRFMVYVTGTRNTGLARTKDPSDLTSNLQLYLGRSSASLTAVQQALAAAGAKPGDIVDPVGHSQGGMIAGRLALDGGYRTTMLVTAGSPTEAQVPSTVLSVQLQHPDVVTDLQGGGSLARVGSEDSIVIRRDPHPDGGPLTAHALDAYGETARRAELSHDARLAPVHRQLAELRSATAVEVTEYDAEQSVAEPSKVPDPYRVPGLDGPFVDADRG